MAGRRTLRNGKEFSAFDFALKRAVTASLDFDTGARIQEAIIEQALSNAADDLDDLTEYAADLSLEPEPILHPPPLPTPTPIPPPNDKAHGNARRRKKRLAAAELASTDPILKPVHHKRIAEAKSSALHLGVDGTALPHTKPSWLGLRNAPLALDPPPIEIAIGGRVYSQDEFEALNKAVLEGSGMGGREYTQEEIDRMVGMTGFMYVAWLGILTIPILDAHRRVIAVLGGRPNDEDWPEVHGGAHMMMQERLPRLCLTHDRLHHRRAQTSFAAVSRGPSFGSGQTEPVELRNNVTNTQLTDELMAHEYFKRIALFANSLLMLWAPRLYLYYQVQMEKLCSWRKLRWNFPGCAFAGATFNFGPRTITAPHVDFANLAWGWCSITALGNFDPDVGGMLILWHLKLVIRFPPGSTVLIPSALVKHSNTPIGKNETRTSFAQYTAGGLFHWLWNGCKTDVAFENADAGVKAQRAAEEKERWMEGMAMYSKIDEL
ncbi:hypothetical protein FB45DRAFT_907465 [Roridomyces roridus]|uniref:Uncharacterized protein n=1 Tax=Roridomyces roridus TaxID=1738132 RepID=A0AAD7FTP7_9AGAR|nr:hypothetical protein FB45DRAFT_907465 [Roridomyces roridus]